MTVKKRVVVHFPGFEPLDAEAHHNRFTRTARQSATVWDFSVEIDALRTDGTASHFDVIATGATWQTASRIYVCDHDRLVANLSDRPMLLRIPSGFCSALRVIFQGGMTGYFRHAWRFGIFFLFPFLLTGLALVASLALSALPFWLGLSPWHCVWSIALALAFFRFVFFPFSERLHTLHLFADWELAVAVASMDDPRLARWLDDCAETVSRALEEEADEYVISSHSMGSSLAVQVLGMVLERNPSALSGKRIVFMTLGGAILQCALLRSAATLRRRIGAIARDKNVCWIEVQCLTDVIHFYKSRVVAIAGHPDAPQASLLMIRVRALLSPERYRKIKRDFLRVHRQYVLNPDLRGAFDFTLMTTGPFSAGLVSDYSKRDFTVLAKD